MTSHHDLHDFMRGISIQMAAEYARIQKRATEDPGTAGDQGEENWASLLRGWLPKTYTVVTKGRIIGHDGVAGPQVDVLVLKPSYPPDLVGTKVYLAAGVAAAFECKVTLKSHHLQEAGDNAVALRGAYQERPGSPYAELHSPLLYGLLAHSHSWKGNQSKPVENIEKCLDELMGATVHPRQMLDVICVADLGTWTATRMTWIGPRLNGWSEAMERIYGANGSARASYMGSYSDYEHQKEHFTPIGSALAAIIRRMAWEDSGMRSIADYFRLANLDGAGRGSMYPFDEAIYSAPVRVRVMAGHLASGAGWDEWSMTFF